jgi:hypothetical protein
MNAGEEVEIYKPKANLHALDILRFTHPQLTLLVKCVASVGRAICLAFLAVSHILGRER